MNDKQAIKTLAALALAALVGACASAPPQAPAAMPSTTAQNGAPSLSSHDWNLTSAFDAQGRPDDGWRVAGRAPVQLHFEGQRLSVRNLCNMLGASFGTQGGDMQLGRPVSTMRACADKDLMRLEQRVGAQLPTVKRYRLDAGSTPRLQLFFADGSRWELAGQPTPQTQYGGPGERMFLEVAPQRVACNHPLMPQAQCLRVRDVHYGDNGVRQSVGEWRIFHGEIEGYQHEAGMRNVLRLQRYPATRPGQPQPADAPRHAYLLDMVVETERVAP